MTAGTSNFGVPAETSIVSSPTVATTISDQSAAVGQTISDSVKIDGIARVGGR